MIPQREVENLTKVFRIPAKPGAPAGASAHLCRPRYNDRSAVDSIRLSIGEGESAAYYPTLLLLDKMNPPPLPSYLAPPAGVAVSVMAALIGRRWLIAYRGTGS